MLRERGRLDEAALALDTALALPRAETTAQAYIDLGLVRDYAERRHEAMAAYEAASRIGGEAADSQAGYLYGRAAKSMAYWRGWDAYNAYVRGRIRSGGSATMQADPVAMLSAPLTPAELLAVVQAAASARLKDATIICSILVFFCFLM